MSIVINNLGLISEYFGVSQQHVIDVVTANSIYCNEVGFYAAVLWCILTFGIGAIVYYVSRNDYDQSDKTVIVLFVFGCVFFLLLTIFYALYVSMNPINIEYNMYYNWVSFAIGV